MSEEKQSRVLKLLPAAKRQRLDVDAASTDVTVPAPRREKHRQEITGGSEPILPGAVLSLLVEN